MYCAGFGHTCPLLTRNKERKIRPASYFRFALASQTASLFARFDTKGSSRITNHPAAEIEAGTEMDSRNSISTPPLEQAQLSLSVEPQQSAAVVYFWAQKSRFRKETG